MTHAAYDIPNFADYAQINIPAGIMDFALFGSNIFCSAQADIILWMTFDGTNYIYSPGSHEMSEWESSGLPNAAYDGIQVAPQYIPGGQVPASFMCRINPGSASHYASVMVDYQGPGHRNGKPVQVLRRHVFGHVKSLGRIQKIRIVAKGGAQIKGRFILANEPAFS